MVSLLLAITEIFYCLYCRGSRFRISENASKVQLNQSKVKSNQADMVSQSIDQLINHSIDHWAGWSIRCLRKKTYYTERYFGFLQTPQEDAVVTLHGSQYNLRISKNKLMASSALDYNSRGFPVFCCYLFCHYSVR